MGQRGAADLMLEGAARLFFVRHGETDWNAARRYQGQRDIPINARGRAQAARNGQVLKAVLGASAEAPQDRVLLIEGGRAHWL